MRSITSYYYSYVHCVSPPPPNSLSSFFVYEHSLYTHVYNEYYICHLSRSHPPTHILTHFPRPPLTHTPHTPPSHPVTFTHNSLTHSQTPPPPHTHQWRSEDVRGPWTTDSLGPLPIVHNLIPFDPSTYTPTQTLYMFNSII